MMKTDLSPDDMVMRITPQIIAGEGGGGEARGAAESGRRLLAAAKAGDTAAVRALMAAGAPFTTDWLGTSPLHVAAGCAHAETVGVLLRAGVSRDARTKVDRTALHVAAAAGHAAVAAKLLAAGAAVDARDMLRMTPLHWAVERGHKQTAALLVRAGADVEARSKFLKTPLGLARRDPAMLRALRRALAEREAAPSVSALLHDQAESANDSEDTAMQTDFDAIETVQPQKSQEATPQKQASQEKTPTKSNNKTETGAGAATGAGGSGGAAALLRAHGITLLPPDDGSTVLSALQSGRTVVLSDAGKLMLKESGAAGSPGGVGVVLTATPVAAPPPGVRVFTLCAGRRDAPAAHADTLADTHTVDAVQHERTEEAATDQQQVKYVQLPAGAKIVPSGGAVGGAASGAPGGAASAAPGGTASGRPNVKIVMSRANFKKLVATALRATPHASADGLWSESEEDEGESVVVVPEQFVRSGSAHYLRSQLLCAHAAIAHLARRLRGPPPPCLPPGSPTHTTCARSCCARTTL